MNGVNPILVVVDPTIEESAAVRKAARLARAARAGVELLVCDFTPELDAARFLDAATFTVAVAPVVARHQLHLDRLAAPLRAAAIDVATRVDFANPLHEGILRRIESLRPGLVIKDSHYHGALRRALFHHADWHLVRDCAAPLLLTKQAPWHAPPRLAAAVDPNHPGDVGATIDHAIIDAAQMLGRVLDARPWVVHVFSTLNLISVEPGIASAPLGTDPAAVKALRLLHRTQLEGIAQRHGVGAADTRLIDGIVTYALPEFAATNGIDILALGVLARSRLHDRIIGSTADRVLDRLACDLLIVKPPRAP